MHDYSSGKLSVALGGVVAAILLARSEEEWSGSQRQDCGK
jgi:hypothetical protein